MARVYYPAKFEPLNVFENYFYFLLPYAIMVIERKRGAGGRPEVSLFYGIRITMFYSDHNPPHFHAEYGEHKVLVDIQGGYVIRGAMPARQLKFILAWCEMHQDELMQNWELAKDAKPLNHIDPL